MEEDWESMFGDDLRQEEVDKKKEESVNRVLYATNPEELRKWFAQTEQEKFTTKITQLPIVTTDPEFLQVEAGADIYYTDPKWKKTKTGKQRVRKVRKERVLTREQRRQRQRGEWIQLDPTRPDITTEDIRQDQIRIDDARRKRKIEWRLAKLEAEADRRDEEQKRLRMREDNFQQKILNRWIKNKIPQKY